MRYLEVMQAVDPKLCLKYLEIPFTEQGSYINFPCPKCGKQAAIKAYGIKKNLIYCQHCKESGHVIKLVMELQGMDWEAAKKYLKEKAMPLSLKRLTREINITYDLQYTSQLAEKGLTEGFCHRMGIGYPKGKTMLAGCIAFEVRNEDHLKIAYYGLKVKDNRPVFHRSFNPELYIYGMDMVDKEFPVYFTTDLWKCVQLIQNDVQAVCNFGLPYLSTEQVRLLEKCSMVVYHRDGNFSEIMRQVKEMKNYSKIID